MRVLPFLAAGAALLVFPACDAFGGGPPTIGGTYSGSGPTNSGNIDSVTLTIPRGTESDPDVSFTIQGNDADSGAFTVTSVYDFPTLRLTAGVSGGATCTVSDDGGALTCAFSGGDLELTR